MQSVTQVLISKDAYHVCSQHVHTTDGEEVMGLLVGQYIPVESEKDSDSGEGDEEKSSEDSYICDIIHAVILGRSDKRKDRVEISPEMLIEAQQRAEEISKETGTSVNIVGWYHSHPKITVFPSNVDLKTQWGYQQMDKRFVGLIFSVFNKADAKGIHEEVVGGFQAVPVGSVHGRINLPVIIKPTKVLAKHNQEALCSLSKILQQEQLSVLEQSEKLCAIDNPLQHAYNNAVAVQRVTEICDAIPAPMTALLHSRLQQIQHSVKDMDAHIHYLTKLVRDNELKNCRDDTDDNPTEVNGSASKKEITA